jgi:hypothetical protein
MLETEGYPQGYTTLFLLLLLLHISRLPSHIGASVFMSNYSLSLFFFPT